MTIHKTLRKKKRGGSGGGSDQEQEELDLQPPNINETTENLQDAIDKADRLLNSLPPRSRGGCGCGG